MAYKKPGNFRDIDDYGIDPDTTSAIKLQYDYHISEQIKFIRRAKTFGNVEIFVNAVETLHDLLINDGDVDKEFNGKIEELEKKYEEKLQKLNPIDREDAKKVFRFEKADELWRLILRLMHRRNILPADDMHEMILHDD